MSITSAAAGATMILALGLSACGPQGGGAAPPSPDDGGGIIVNEPPTGEPYIEGDLTDVAAFVPITEDCVPPPKDADPDGTVSSDDPPFCSTGDEGPGSILVEKPGEGNKASLTITRETGLWRETSSGLEEATFDDFEEGQTVAAWVSGPVMESFPVQAGADSVVIRAD